MEAGADLKAEHHTKETPLHKAVLSGCVEIVRVLLDGGESEQTPLFSAAQFGHFETVRLLLDAGADIEAEDHHQMRPMHEALGRFGHWKVIKMLEEAGAKPVDQEWFGI